MTTNPLEIHAILWPTEQPLFQAAVQLLSECLEAAGDQSGPVQLTFYDAVRSDFLVAGGPGIHDELHQQKLVPSTFRDYRGSIYQGGKRIVVVSLLVDLLQSAWRHRQAGYLFIPLPAWRQSWTPAQHAWLAEHFIEEPPLRAAIAAQNWLEICVEIMRSGEAGVFLDTVFRHVPETIHGRGVATQALRQRIMRFNMLAAEVSHDSGAYVIDLDRTFSEIGARKLQTDYQLAGNRAASAGADAMVRTLLQSGLNDLVPADILEKAAANFEARLADPQRLHVGEYLGLLSTTLEGIAPQVTAAKNAEDMTRLSDLFRLHASRFGKLAPPGNLAGHRRLVRVLQDLSARFRELADALAAGDTRAYQQARQRTVPMIDEVKVLWKEICDFCQQQLKRSG